MYKFKNFSFRGQRPGEKIVKIVRRHWFNILQQYFIVFLFVFLLFLGLQVLPAYLSFDENKNIFWFIASTFATITWIYSFIIWIDYYFDVWIITDTRIVNVEQKALFVRTVSELKFAKIQDIHTEVKGLIPTILNYGDVYIQTAGTKERFLFRKVPDPYRLKGMIMNMQSKTIKKEEAEFIAKASPFMRRS